MGVRSRKEFDSKLLANQPNQSVCDLGMPRNRSTFSRRWIGIYIMAPAMPEELAAL